MNNIEIRLATYDDCKKLALLQKEIWESNFRGIYPDEKLDKYDYDKKQHKFESFIDNPSQHLYVVTDNDEIIGYLEFGIPFRPFRNYTQEIGLVYLRKDYQGQNLGKKMFDFAYEYFKNTGVKEFFISCNKFNLNGQKFYEKMGGKIVHVDDDSENDGVPQIKYEYLVK